MGEKMAGILLVEDDAAIVKNLTEFLKREGFSVISAEGQQEAFAALQENTPMIDLVLLDVTLSNGNGFAVCAKIKSETELPVIFLTASGDEFSIVTGLDIGADDYIAKPFRPRELISRINSVLRRYQKTSSVLTCRALTLDTSKAAAYKNGEELALSTLEYRLLLYFMQNQGQALSRDMILDAMWDFAGEYVNDNTLSVYVKRLREKIEDDPSNPTYIRTLRAIGYRMGD